MSATSQQSPRDAEYVMGHSADEHERLEIQSRMLRPCTEEMFRRAGLVRGMRVLDLGCGVGDVSMLAAEFVGSEGSVTGVDSDAGSVEVAKRRAAARGLKQVQFIASDFRSFSGAQPFDAVVGRLILLFQADPSAALRHAASQLRPGGIVAIQDVLLDETVVRSLPRVELYQEFCGWAVKALRQGGARVTIGMELHKVFAGAGLPKPQLAWSTLLADAHDDDFFLYMDKFIRPFVPKILEFGIATEAQVDVENVARKIREETRRLDAELAWFPITSAWTRKP